MHADRNPDVAAPDPIEEETAVAAANSLSVDRVGMSFNGRSVLRDVSASFTFGAVHGLVGHNGSGKSTLIRILAGYYLPTSGSLALAGDPLTLGSPTSSHKAGLRFVHQDLGLVQEFTALENFGLGADYSTNWRGIDWREQRRRLETVLTMLHCDVPLDRPVSKLTAVQRSLVAIGRAVGAGIGGRIARFLVLDEPTAALEGPETEQLFRVIRRLSSSGVGVLYVSHQLDDVLDLCRDIHVLRDGQLVAIVESDEMTHDQLVHAMLGDAWESTPEKAVTPPTSTASSVTRTRPEQGTPKLSVSGLTSPLLRKVDLSVGLGECVFAVGLSGSGREELVYAIAGAIPCHFERMEIDGAPIDRHGLRECLKHGIALVPGNRLPGAVVADFRMRENLTFAALDRCTDRWGQLDTGKETALARQWIDTFQIKPADPDYRTRHLSGGNKQKVILAKWLSMRPTVMLIDEPTAGVDVGAAHAILTTLRSLADDGMSLLVSTSEISDALTIADRILVLSEGHCVRDLSRNDGTLSEHEILSAMSQSGERDFLLSTTEADSP